jgi:hypothetical protein
MDTDGCSEVLSKTAQIQSAPVVSVLSLCSIVECEVIAPN